MFDLVRKHIKVLMFLMFLLIIPAFVLVGVDGYGRLNDSAASAVARIGGRDITQAEWDFAHKSEADRVRANVPTIDAKSLDSPQARYASLERLVRERVLAQAAESARLATSDARLARELQRNPSIAALRGPNGKLDMERYRQLAASQGFTPEGYEARVRRDLSVRQVEVGLIGSAFSSAAVADVALGAFFEKREVQVANFASADFKAKVTPSEADIEAYYKSKPWLFQASESVNVEYVVLDTEAIKKSITLSEPDLKSYYEQNVVRLSGKEERRASHILIAASKDAPPADRAKAKARAQELLAEVRKSPADFAKLAIKNSQDPGSAPAGGDLDFFARGAMVKPFDEAAFAMKKDDISDVVESDFGYHIIQLTDVKEPKQLSFEELRPSIEANLRAQQAQRKFAEQAEAFTNGVYEQSDSLKPVADRLKLETRTANNVTRKPGADVVGALANEKFIAALFSDDAIRNKRNTEAVEVGPNQLAAGRVVAHSPARTLPLAEVHAAARDELVNERAAALAKTEGQARLAAWKSTPGADIGPVVLVSRDQPPQAQALAPELLDAALRSDPATFPALAGVDLGAQGYAVVKVVRIVSRSAPSDAIAAQGRVQYTQVWAEAEDQAYYGLLKERYKARITTPKPAPSVVNAVAGASQ